MENEKKYFVVQYPLWELDVQTLHKLFEDMKATLAEFTDDPLIMMPNVCQFTEMTREQLEEVKKLLNYALEKKDDTNSEAGTGAKDCG